LQALIDGFKAGTLSLASKDDNLLLHPPDLLGFKIKAKKRDDKTKIDIKIEWKNAGTGTADSALRIGH
jgi:amphi-Trp domain-containing protein